MADTLAARLSLDDVRASVKRVQTEGRKLVDPAAQGRLCARQAPSARVWSTTLASGATKAVRDLQAQSERVQALVVEQHLGIRRSGGRPAPDSRARRKCPS